MANRNYLVTGGSGFIGSALVRRLVNDGHTVRVLDNDLRGVAARLEGISGKLEMVQADIRDAGAVQEAIRGMDSVCHLAYLNGTEFFYSKPELVLDIGVKGMVNVLDGCINEGVKELVLVSSSEVYQSPDKIPVDENVALSVPDPMNPRYSYGGGKIISELMAINYGRKFFDRVIIIRPHNVYGPDMGWEHVIPQFVVRMKELADSQPEQTLEFSIQGSGKETRAFVFIDDFVDGMVTAMEKGGHLEIYNVGTMEEITVAFLAKQVGDYFQRNIELVPGDLAKGGTLRRCPEIAKLQALGFAPKVSLEDGLKATAKWYEANIDNKPKKDRIDESIK